MNHPLNFLPSNLYKPLFVTFLALTLVLFAVLDFVGKPLKTFAAPHGIISFEFAGSPECAQLIVSSWQESRSGFPDDVIVLDAKPKLYAAFSLGLDYLFMPTYALALALGISLAARKHSDRFSSFGWVAGWGAVVAALFDAVENYALFRVLLGEFASPYPEIAAVCAAIKFALIILGGVYAGIGFIRPKRAQV